MSFTTADMDACLKVLQAVADNPSLANHDERFTTLLVAAHRRTRQGFRRRRANDEAADAVVTRQTAIIRAQLPAAPTPIANSTAPATYTRQHACYVCKAPFVRVHHFYHALCPECANTNWTRRNQRADMTGRVALVTGGRVKIGYQLVLKMLRDGARVWLTTRFPVDAVRRLSEEPDWATWRERVFVYGLDLRDPSAIEAFADHLLIAEPHLDALVHNAAQTVKRPLAFYQHLLDQPALSNGSATALVRGNTEPVLVEMRPGYRGHLVGTEAFFPPGVLDRDGQQVDLRTTNSWRLKLGEVGTVELLEVLLVGSVAPFVLTGRLLDALKRSPNARRFVVNVSAMEGQFARQTKTAFHPHTNMTKAALNMLTRTAAEDLARAGVYLNSVDTGWVTDEDPIERVAWKQDEKGFYPPLDTIDGAARVYDPIVRGVSEPGEPISGQFLKDYAPCPW